MRSTEPLDPLRGIRLTLPRALRAKPGLARRVKAVGDDGAALAATVHPRRIALSQLESTDAISLTLPRGVLKRMKSVRRGHKLVFRVLVWFQDGSKQTIVLRRRAG